MVKKTTRAPKPAELPSFILNKGPSGLTKVSVNEYKGKMTLDFRFHYRDKESGEYRPSPKGTGVPLEKSRVLLTKLRRLIEAAEEQGLQMSLPKED